MNPFIQSHPNFVKVHGYVHAEWMPLFHRNFYTEKRDLREALSFVTAHQYVPFTHSLYRVSETQFMHFPYRIVLEYKNEYARKPMIEGFSWFILFDQMMKTALVEPIHTDATQDGVAYQYLGLELNCFRKAGAKVDQITYRLIQPYLPGLIPLSVTITKLPIQIKTEKTNQNRRWK